MNLVRRSLSIVCLAIVIIIALGALGAAMASSVTNSGSPNTGELYAGTSNPGIVYRHTAGNTWEATSPTLGYAVLSLLEYEGHLYAGTMSTSNPDGGIGQVYRHDSGTNWTLIGDNLDNQVSSLVVYQGNLYAGTAWKGMRLYKYTPGTTNCGIANWTRVVNYTAWNGTRHLAVSHGYVLMGDIYWDTIGHWDGSTFHPDQTQQTGSCIYDFDEYGGYVYGAAYLGRMWRSLDGIHWSLAPGFEGRYDGSMWEVETFHGSLYMAYADGELRASTLPDRGMLIYTAPDGIISMVTDGANLYFGTGGEAGALYGSEAEGIANIYSYDGANVQLISSQDQFGGGVQVLIVVDKANSTTETQLHQAGNADPIANGASITLGGSVYDVATVTGLSDPDIDEPAGNVMFDYQYKLNTADPWPETWTKISINGLNGGTATSGGFKPDEAGYYRFRAHYTGDSNYNESYSSLETELLVVDKANSTTETQLHQAGNDDPIANGASITLGGSVYDVATVTGLSDPDIDEPAGNVMFDYQYKLNTADPWPETWTKISINGLNGGTATSGGFKPDEAGYYRFRAHYTGDSNYNESYSSLETELLVVDKANSTTETQLHQAGNADPIANGASITLGGSVYDVATVTGLSDPDIDEPAGNVMFDYQYKLNTADPWPETWTKISINGLNGGTATSGGFKPDEAGYYRFRAHYTGDSNYNESCSSLETELLVVDKANSTTETQLHQAGNADPIANGASITLGGSVYDVATVTGLSDPDIDEPAGNVMFDYQYKLNTADPWPETWTKISINGLNGGTATSGGFKPDEAGYYRFRAHYTGDSNYNESCSSLETELLVVDKANSTTETQLHQAGNADPIANGASITLGGSVYDVATVTGLSDPDIDEPAGNVMFDYQYKLNTADPWPETWTKISINGLNGGTATSGGFKPDEAGYYRFRAHYTGDSNYNESCSSLETELLYVAAVSPPTPPPSASSAPPFPNVYVGIGAALGAGILAYFVHRRLATPNSI